MGAPKPSSSPPSTETCSGRWVPSISSSCALPSRASSSFYMKLRGGAGGNDGQICRRRGTRSEVPLHPPRTLNQVVLLRDCLDALREPHHQHTDRGPLAHSVGPAQGGVRDLRLGPLPLTAYTSPSGRIPRLFPGRAGFALHLVAALSR